MSIELGVVVMSDTRVSVVVGGAGLAGLAAATFLGRHGVRALLVERHEDMSNQPKARGQFPPTMEALRVAGLAEEFSAATEEGGMSIYIAASVCGPVFTEILSINPPDFSELSPRGWADVSQERAERILARRARELGAELRFNTKVESVGPDCDGVTVTLEDQRTIRADYLVAADGHRSPIRAALGIGTHGRGMLGESAGTLFDADLSSVITTRTALYNLRNPDLPGGGGAVVTTDTPGRYVLNTGLDDGKLPTPQRWVELIRIATGMPDLRPRLVPSADRIFEVSHRIVDRFSDGRVFLVGDAGKVMPPTGGSGGNVAILDSYQLAWKLAMVVNGEAGPGLLASHDPERRPYADAIAGQQYAAYVERHAPGRRDGTEDTPMEPATLFFGYRNLSGAVALEPDDDGAQWENPARPTGRPGSRAPHVRLARDGAELSTTDLFGLGFTLLAGASGQEWLAAGDKVAGRLGVRLAGYVIDDDMDIDDTFGARYGIGRTGVVLVRPDGVIAWRAKGSGGVEELESALRGVLDRRRLD
jgi:2-polyprenyl-6-methoxyphenol hydroxylase-like FAD-dependent oxidoreductase